MPSRPKSTPATFDVPPELMPPAPAPPPFDPYGSGMRHTYTARLLSWMHEFMERLCKALIQAQDEGGITPGGPGGECPTVRDLRAAAQDLDYLAGWLAYVGKGEDLESRWEHRLADLAERLASRVGEIAGEIEAAIAAAPAE